MSDWKKEKPINKDGLHIGCLNCSTAALKANLGRMICVGFGAAFVTKDGAMVYDGEQDFSQTDSCKEIKDIEVMAVADPDHDWRVHLHGPMHGEVYQRHGIDEWLCIESDNGFA